MTKTLDTRKDRDIWAIIDRRLGLWERGLHAVLVWDVVVEGKDREVRTARDSEEE